MLNLRSIVTINKNI